MSAIELTALIHILSLLAFAALILWLSYTSTNVYFCRGMRILAAMCALLPFAHREQKFSGPWFAQTSVLTLMMLAAIYHVLRITKSEQPPRNAPVFQPGIWPATFVLAVTFAAYVVDHRHDPELPRLIFSSIRIFAYVAFISGAVFAFYFFNEWIFRKRESRDLPQYANGKEISRISSGRCEHCRNLGRTKEVNIGRWSEKIARICPACEADFMIHEGILRPLFEMLKKIHPEVQVSIDADTDID